MAIKRMTFNGRIKYELYDEDGELLVRWKIDPTDPDLLDRFEKGIGKIEEIRRQAGEVGDNFSYSQFNKQLEDLMTGILQQEDLFKNVRAVSLADDGTMFIEYLAEQITSDLAPAVEARVKNMQKKYSRYTDPYTKPKRTRGKKTEKPEA